MTKKIFAVGLLALVLVFGTNVAARAESENSNSEINVWKEKVAKAEKKAAEFEAKLKGTAIKIKSIDDLDDMTEMFLPSLDSSFKNGAALVVGPKGRTSTWFTVTAASQISYVAAPTSPYVNWTLEGDVWGTKVKVNVMDKTATKMTPENTAFKVGDRVAVQGTMKDGIITATKVRNHSMADDKTIELSAKLQELTKKLKELCNQMTTKPAICATL
jgi:hypothetical protein